MSDAYEIVMNRTEGSGEQFAGTGQPAVEFRLHMVMPPALLAECCQLEEGGDLTVENREIRPTSTRVNILLIIGTLRSVKAVPCFS